MAPMIKLIKNPQTTNARTQKIDSNLMNFKDFLIDHIKS